MKNKIRDIDEFFKLYKINIPVKEEFDYYFDTIKSSKEYGQHEMDNKLELFINLEKVSAEKGYDSAYKYKMSEIDRLKDIILESEAYKKFNSIELPNTRLYTRNWINQVPEGSYLISLDFVSANYSVLRTFSENGELGHSWREFCANVDLHLALVGSKTFRQVVFGNTNPKRFQTIQHNRILGVIDYLKNKGFDDNEFVFISHDEVILKVDNAKEANRIQIICENMPSNMAIKSTVFSLKKIKKDTFVKTVYDVHYPLLESKTDDLLCNKTYYFRELHKVLHGAPGNKFFMYYKKYILEQPFDDRDLIYYNDGELCRWIDEDVKKEKKNALPHYEKPQYVISTEQAKTEYAYIWSEMVKILPNLSDEEKRRIVEIVHNSSRVNKQN